MNLVVAMLIAAAPSSSAAEHLAKGEASLAALEYEAAAYELMLAATDASASDDVKLKANLEAGIAHRVLGKDLDARMNFRYVLLRAPKTALPDDISPKVRLFFESVRQEIEAERPATAPTTTTPPTPPTTTGAPPTTAEPTTTTATTQPPASTSFPWLGVGVIGVGAGIAAVAGGGALLLEAALADPNRKGDDIDEEIGVGRVLLGVAGVGVVVAGAGAGIVAFGGD